ncbi:alpha-hydroxy acid oxidase [Piscinibacter sakaiensis]|uniref:alpha-hydroxy acid oxidase n=1 Tax=Piscinibacter sakaiensis TaxID=1547922 RepID=UPI003AAD6068
MSKLARAASIEDLRQLARKRLPRVVFDFIDGAAGNERTLRENQQCFADWQLMPRVGVDVSDRSLATRIVGHDAKLPLILAPTGLAGMFYPGGEMAAASAAEAAGIPYCLSTNSVASIEEVAAAVPGGDRWFQLYIMKDRGLTDALLERAARSGYRVLCVTVDLPIQGKRDRDVRNSFTVPLRPRPGTILDVASHPRWLIGLLRSNVRFGNFVGSEPEGFTSIAKLVGTLFDPSANWDDIARIREKWKGPVVVKGVLHPDDARRAVEIGCDGVIVSNHGGRQLDQVPASVTALPAIAEAVGGRAEVILDSGVRRGTDILVARALGASACMIGRAFLWGLASGGQAGVTRTIDILRDELDNALALLGQRRFVDVGHQSAIRSHDHRHGVPRQAENVNAEPGRPRLASGG